MSGSMKILAVDLGTRRTGFAISDPEERMALALPTLENVTPAEAARVAGEQGAGRVVVGLPLNMDGTEGPAARRALEFAEELRLHLEVPVETWDERLSTVEGGRRLREAGLSRKERSKRADVAAAVVILESYLGRKK
jgi:putative Holliday junction resolvase